VQLHATGVLLDSIFAVLFVWCSPKGHIIVTSEYFFQCSYWKQVQRSQYLSQYCLHKLHLWPAELCSLTSGSWSAWDWLRSFSKSDKTDTSRSIRAKCSTFCSDASEKIWATPICVAGCQRSLFTCKRGCYNGCSAVCRREDYHWPHPLWTERSVCAFFFTGLDQSPRFWKRTQPL